MREEFIDEAIDEFEKYNRLHINEYVSDSLDIDDDRKRDNYIGKDVFKTRILEWLQSFGEEDRKVFLELLKKYRYYTENKLRKVFINWVKYIKDNYCNEQDMQSVFFVTFPSKNGIQSGGDSIRSLFEISTIGMIKKDNFIADTQKNKERIVNEGKVVVFFDDVVGTGTTMYGNIVRVYNELEMNKYPEKKLVVALVCANEKVVNDKIKDLNKRGIGMDVLIYEKMEKCFRNDGDGIFEKNLAEEYREIVRKYEEEIQKNNIDGSDKNFILGFGKCEFLLSFFYNTPNNTLSNFWRPSKVSVPLFIRSSYVRPRIDFIKEQKLKNQKNGYEMKKMENDCDEGE